MRAMVATLVTVSALMCASGPTLSESPQPSSVTIKSITPPVGSKVKASTIIRAEVEYHIQVFGEKGVKYVLLPMFETTSGRTVNLSGREQQLKSASGTVKVSYPIASEWADPSVAKPFKMYFSILRVASGFKMPHVNTEPVIYVTQNGA